MNPMILVWVGVGIIVFLWLAFLASIIIQLIGGDGDGISALFAFLLVTAVILLIVGGIWQSHYTPPPTMPDTLRESFEKGYDPTNEAPTKGGQ